MFLNCYFIDSKLFIKYMSDHGGITFIHIIATKNHIKIIYLIFLCIFAYHNMCFHSN